MFHLIKCHTSTNQYGFSQFSCTCYLKFSSSLEFQILFLSLGLKEYVVISAFMVQGHLIPFSALPRKLQERSGFTIPLLKTSGYQVP